MKNKCMIIVIMVSVVLQFGAAYGYGYAGSREGFGTALEQERVEGLRTTNNAYVTGPNELRENSAHMHNEQVTGSHEKEEGKVLHNNVKFSAEDERKENSVYMHNERKPAQEERKEGGVRGIINNSLRTAKGEQQSSHEDTNATETLSAEKEAEKWENRG